MSVVPDHTTVERCGNCRFWTQLENEPVHGACRRAPPTVLPDGRDRFPILTEDQWCGEWREKPETEAKS